MNRRILSKKASPQVMVHNASGASLYGASFLDGGVVLFNQTIRDGAIRWKPCGATKWDERYGMYAIEGHLPDGVSEKLTAGLRGIER